MGAMACLLVLSRLAPPPVCLGRICADTRRDGDDRDVDFLPSLGLTLIAGLLAIAFNRPYHNASWAWLKAASGLLVFESGFVGVMGPMQQEAERSAGALAGQVDPATLAGSPGAEQGVLWVLLAVATVNVMLGIWRPRLVRRIA